MTALIKNRSKLDTTYYPKLYGGGIPDFDENVICTYSDLDVLIEKSSLSPGESFVVKQSMAGYSFSDIAEKYGSCAQAYRGMFNRAVAKIVESHNEQWYYVTRRKV